MSRHGVGRTATVLGLDYYSLKKRAEDALRLHLVGYDAAEIASLVRSLWNAE